MPCVSLESPMNKRRSWSRGVVLIFPLALLAVAMSLLAIGVGPEFGPLRGVNSEYLVDCLTCSQCGERGMTGAMSHGAYPVTCKRCGVSWTCENVDGVQFIRSQGPTITTASGPPRDIPRN